MDPTTTSHLDSATLNHQPGTAGDVPSLNVQSTPEIKSQGTTSSSTGPAATGLRQRVNTLGTQLDQATDHPAVKNAKDAAGKQVNQFREFLGGFPTVRNLEKRFGVDRVILVVGGIFAYILLVPLNLFRLALPITQCLTYVPPAMLALEALDRGDSAMDQDHVKLLLSYFVVLGLIQFTESLIPGVLERKIPQYWTVKLVFLAYMIHPQTQGALKIHQSVLRNVVGRGPSTRTQTQTPPQTQASVSHASSPTAPAAVVPPQ